MKKIGITGGIGVGKSTASAVFKLLGIPVYDADTRAKWLMSNDEILVQSVKNTFGEEAYVNGILNNQYLASIVFSDPVKVETLNKLVHPRVGEDFKNWTAQQYNVPYVLKEAALLYEANSWKELDKIIVVTAPLELRINRVLKRDPHRDRQQVLDIIQRQMPEEEKISKADFCLYNNEETSLIQQIIDIHNQLIA